MALTELIYGSPTLAQVGLVQFDCSLEETHIDEAEITSHPVEVGSDISDHIRKLPVAIQLNGLVTETPIVLLASLFAKSPLVIDLNPTDTRTESAYGELRRIMDDGETVDVITSLREYTNMAITSMSVVRNRDNGNVLNCTLNLVEIIQATAFAVDLPLPVNAANKAAANAGKVAKKAPSAEQATAGPSALSQAKDAALSVLGLA